MSMPNDQENINDGVAQEDQVDGVKAGQPSNTSSRVEEVISEKNTAPLSIIINESERVGLENSIIELCGGGYTELAYVLSFSPERAEAFIRTQRYAQRITGQNHRVCYIVTHNKDEVGGLDGKSIYRAGYSEHLPNTCRDIIDAIKAIQYLRREDPMMIEIENMCIFADILLGNGDTESIHARILEKMKLTIHEKNIIIAIANNHNGVNQLNNKVAELVKSADALEKEAAKVRREADGLKFNAQNMREEIDGIFDRYKENSKTQN